MGRLAVIPEAIARRIISRQLAFDAVCRAFESVAAGHSRVFDVALGTGLNDGEVFALKSGLDGDNRLVGSKCGTCWAGNNATGHPSHGSTVLLPDPGTGFPHALINASCINGYRTAAADAVAVSCLSREDSSVLGVIGAGAQVRYADF